MARPSPAIRRTRCSAPPSSASSKSSARHSTSSPRSPRTSYRDVEELLAERGIDVDHATVYRWVQRFTPSLVDARGPAGTALGTGGSSTRPAIKVAGYWTYLYRAVNLHGQVIDVLASTRRDQAAARPFFTAALSHGRRPVEVTTDKAAVYPRILDELLPKACHADAARENNRIEADHGRLKARLRPMRGLKRLLSQQACWLRIVTPDQAHPVTA
ncbi:putative transposase (fragment) [Frankia alni ACN14a]|uniref:Transposase n=1 Tax=Frankia alni (strain DSM 45986 / CECT 9034 / ACN14a) TaxID=326424 RepID=Q0RHD1_FRAAA